MESIVKKLWIAMVMLCLSISASAYDFEVDGIAYTITSFTDLTVSVDQLVNNDATKIVIPESVAYKNKTLNVTGIKANAFKDNTNISEISLPNTITSIGANAFMNDSSLVTINTPHSLSSIGSYAFAGCSSLTAFFIPEGIEKINDGTFQECKSLKNIELHSSINLIGESAFYGSGLQSIVIPSSVVSIGNRAFAGTKLVEINLPAGIETIPEGCFSGCSELQNITFSSNVISSGAFQNCIALQEITLPESLTTIGDMAFAGCKNLKEIAIPSSVSKIEPTILWDCQNLETLKIGSGLRGFPVYANYDYSRRSYSYETLGGYYEYTPRQGIYGPKIIDETYLQNVKEFIIEDSDTEFSIKGFQINNNTTTPPFTNTDLDYYYVGRPLVDIKRWSSDIGSTGFDVKIKQGTGRISKLEIGGKCTSVPYFYQRVDTLKLGANITKFDLSNIYKENLAKIECLSVTPPICLGNFPTKVYTDAILCVPVGCKEAYANAEIWKNFWNIYEVDNESGITKISNVKDDVLYHVYNIAGLQVGESYSLEEIKQLPNGIYILVNKSQKYKIKI